MTRGELKVIYTEMSDTQRTTWAKLAGYATSDGLYNFLKNNQSTKANKAIVDSLTTTVGPERVTEMLSEIRDTER